MNTIEHHFHRECAVHMLVDDACCASCLTGARHKSPRSTCTCPENSDLVALGFSQNAEVESRRVVAPPVRGALVIGNRHGRSVAIVEVKNLSVTARQNIARVRR